MTETILEKLARFAQRIWLPRFKRIEDAIGYKLIFRNIPSDYINGWMACEMTKTWKKFGLDVERGANYFTMGSIHDGESSRFDPDSVKYQSWLGGYTVKLEHEVNWTPEDHFKLAVADQNNWLRHYGDPRPVTDIEGWNFVPVGEIQIDQHSGQLYEFGCTTDDDVGSGYNTIKLRFTSAWIAASFNLLNPDLKLRGDEFKPRKSDKVYGRVRLLGYFAIFDIAERVKVVLYGNGFIDERKHVNTFTVLKDNLLNAIKFCEIVAV